MNRLRFAKEGRAKYISHLDLIRTMQRVFVRAGIELKHTEGFNPHAYMAFATPLSVGTESRCELMDFVLTGGAALAEVPERVTAAAPEGITALSAYIGERKLSDIAWIETEGFLCYDSVPAGEAAAALKELYGREKLVIGKKSKRGIIDFDVIPGIKSLELAPEGKRVRLRALLAAGDAPLSPAVLLDAARQAEPRWYPDFASFRRLELFDRDMTVFR